MSILGAGTFGCVIANPRLPIKGEKYDDIYQLDEVSKVVYTMKQYNLESNVLKRIHADVSDYCVLPIKSGQVSHKVVIEHEEYHDISGEVSWGDEGLYHGSSPVSNIIIFPMGECMVSYMKYCNLNTYPKLIGFMRQLKQLTKGLTKLHKNNIVHLDIKLDNMLFIDDKIKFNDCGELFRTDDIAFYESYKFNQVANNVFYSSYGPFAVWMGLYYNSNTSRKVSLKDMVDVASGQCKDLYKNVKYWSNFKAKYLTDYPQLIDDYTNVLSLETFNIVDMPRRKCDLVPYIRPYVENMNALYSRKRENEQKNRDELLKRMDLRAMGYMLLGVIKDNEIADVPNENEKRDLGRILRLCLKYIQGYDVADYYEDI
jgi:hypothetical protein